MTTINFIYHPSLRKGNNPGKVRMRVTHNRKSRVVTLPFAIYPNEWDHNARTILLPDRTDSRSLYLEKARARMDADFSLIRSISTELEEKGRYTIEDVMALFESREDNGKLHNYVTRLSRELVAKGQERTAKAYMTAARGLIEFNKGDICLKHLNRRIITDFEAQMKAKGKAPNTISYYMRNLRAIYNRAVASKIISSDENPFTDVYTGVSKTRKRALSAEDINLLYNLDIEKMMQNEKDRQRYGKLEKLYFSWRLFFFCFHARGMCFVDLAYLRKENLRNGILTYYRRKTGGRIEVKVTTQMAGIIQSFSRDVQGSDYLFPIITDSSKPARPQYENGLNIQNKRLKELAALAGIRSVLSTHVARHSWASMCKVNNIPLWVISEGLGHENEKTTYTYLASLDRSVIDYANEMITRSLAAASRKPDQRSPFVLTESMLPLFADFVEFMQRSGMRMP